MGLSNEEISILAELRKAGHIAGTGAVMEIGAQQLSHRFLESRKELLELANIFGISAPCPLPDPKHTFVVHGRLAHQGADAPMAEQFWRWLGYDYASIDVDGSPGSIPLDLNYDAVPEHEQGKYQIVTNCGTTEHVANQFNAFKVIHELTALNGVMIHNVPAQGMLNHGLINYTHKFFWMLCRSNGYQLLQLKLNSDEVPYALPENIRETAYDARTGKRLKNYQAVDCLLVAVMKKTFDIPYVAPIDVPTGTHTDNQTLRERYWTVFTPNAFAGK